MCRFARAPVPLPYSKGIGTALHFLNAPAWPKPNDLGHVTALVVLRTNPREFWTCSRYWVGHIVMHVHGSVSLSKLNKRIVCQAHQQIAVGTSNNAKLKGFGITIFQAC